MTLQALSGRRLKFLRRRSGMTQEQLAEAADLSVDQIGCMERGKSAASFDTLEKLANALHVPVRDLFDFSS